MLIKVATEFNIGLSTIIDYLQLKGFEIDNKPTSIITDAMYSELQNEFILSNKPKNEFIKGHKNMLITVATEFNIGLSTIVDYLQLKGFEIDNKPTSIITDAMYSELQNEFNLFNKHKTEFIKGNKMLIKVAMELNVSLSTIVHYLQSKGFEIENKPTFILTDAMYSELVQKFTISNLPKPEYIETASISNEDTLNNEKDILNEPILLEIKERFTAENPHETFIIDSINKGIDFENRSPEKRQIGGETVETIFTDYEAYSICLGSEDTTLRKIARQYFKGNILDANLILAHNSCMSALQKYGAKYLSIIFSLPPLPFQAFDARQLFSEMDIRNQITDRPVFRIFIGEKKYTLKFYEITSKDFISKEIIAVNDKDTKQPFFYISRSGKILPIENITNIIPTLSIFLRNAVDFRTVILNYGLESGECSICGRTLTDPFFIRLGIGPVCGGYK